MKSALICTAGVALYVLAVRAAAPGRFEEFTQKFARTPDRAEIVASTLLGSTGTEWLAAGGFQPDGTIVAAGVSLGPELDLGVKAVILGADGPIRAPVRRPIMNGARFELDKKGEHKFEPLTWNHPNATAFVVRLSPDARTIKSVTRLGWTTGGLTSAVVDANGNIYIAGPATNGIEGVSADTQRFAASEKSDRKAGCTQVYVAKLAPDGSSSLWVRTIAGPSGSPALSLDKAGNIHLQGQDVRVIDTNGKQLSVTTFPAGTGAHVSVSPTDGSIARGGEHQWPTGREPYRDPTLDIYRPDGAWLYELYNWDGPFVGLNDLRLVSDSAIRGVIYDGDGKLLLHGWSDGGNSVLFREPIDVFAMAKGFHGLGLSAWGAGVLSCAYVIRIDPATCRVDAGTLWLGYLKDRNRPNSVTINSMAVARDGSVCLGGSSAWGLIQTGNAFPGEPTGNYVAVMSRDLTSLRFSSVVPGAGETEVSDGAHWGIASGTVNGKTLALFFSGAGVEAGSPAPPAVNARQDKLAGGLSDGHLLVLDLSAGK